MEKGLGLLDVKNDRRGGRFCLLQGFAEAADLLGQLGEGGGGKGLGAVGQGGGRTVRYGYNSQRQVTSVTYPDGLRSSREYDEKGRLTAETSRSGETKRYSYDDPASELPTGIEDAKGSTKQMAWSRYGQVLAFTDCSG